MKFFSFGIIASVLVIVLMGANFMVNVGINDPHSNKHLVESYLRTDSALAVNAETKTVAEKIEENKQNDTQVLGVSNEVSKEVCKPKGTLYSYLKANNMPYSFADRTDLARAHGIVEYRGTLEQNEAILEALECLKK